MSKFDAFMGNEIPDHDETPELPRAEERLARRARTHVVLVEKPSRHYSDPFWSRTFMSYLIQGERSWPLRNEPDRDAHWVVDCNFGYLQAQVGDRMVIEEVHQDTRERVLVMVTGWSDFDHPVYGGVRIMHLGVV